MHSVTLEAARIAIMAPPVARQPRKSERQPRKSGRSSSPEPDQSGGSTPVSVQIARPVTRTATGEVNWRNVALVAGVPIVLLAIAVVSTIVDEFPGPNDGLQWVAVCLGSIGVFVFTVLYYDSGDIRTALAAALAITYFSSLFLILFNSRARDAVTGDAKDLFQGFTGLVGVMVVFYFGGKTVESTTEKKAKIEQGVDPATGEKLPTWS
jgi:drug/metabolite transporter (DMT)-like permease